MQLRHIYKRLTALKQHAIEVVRGHMYLMIRDTKAHAQVESNWITFVTTFLSSQMLRLSFSIVV